MEKKQKVEKKDNPVVSRCLEKRISYPNDLGNHIMHDMLLSTQEDFESSLSETAQRYGLSVEDTEKEIQALINKRGYVSDIRKYIQTLKKDILIPNPCAIRFLSALRYPVDADAGTYLAFCIMDGDSTGEGMFQDVAEVFRVPADTIRNEIYEIVSVHDITKQYEDVADAIDRLQDLLRTPTKVICQALDAYGIDSEISGYKYLGTAAKFVILGNRKNGAYLGDVAAIYGDSLSNVNGQCHYSLKKAGYNGSIYSFLKGICFDAGEGGEEDDDING